MNLQHQPTGSSSGLSTSLGSCSGDIYRSTLCGRNIRLIYLGPGSGNEIIRCSLVKKCLDGDVSYIALSYVWGDTNDNRLILCDGKQFMITSSLYSFLWRLREEGEETLLWADAICINQSNVKEKTTQIRMMLDIYKNAKIVMAWLGEGSEHDKFAVDLIQHIHANCQWNSPDEILDPKFVTRNLGDLSGFAAPAWAGLTSIFSCPWFSRVWIVQESTAAESLIFRTGKQRIEAEALFHVYQTVITNSELRGRLIPYASSTDSMTGNISELCNIRRAWRSDSSILRNLIDLVISTKNFKATLPRDKIIALVGLSSDTRPEFIGELSEAPELLIRLVKSALQTVSLTVAPMDLLSHAIATSRDPQQSDVPSWVPPFHDYPKYHPLVSHFRGYLKDVLFSIPPSSFGSHNTLHISGIFCDTIKATVDFDSRSGPILSEIMKDMDYWDVRSGFQAGKGKLLQRALDLAAWEGSRCRLAQSLNSYPTGEHPLDAYWRTLLLDTLEDANILDPKSVVHPPQEYKKRWISYTILYSILPGTLQGSGPGAFFDGSMYILKIILINVIYYQMHHFSWLSSSLILRIWVAYGLTIVFGALLCRFLTTAFYTARLYYVSALANHALPFEEKIDSILRRKFCITEKGYMGWVPDVADAGDRLCAFQASRVLFAVCPYRDGYRLLGDAYIHGLMDGKAYDMPDAVFENIIIY